MNLVIDDKVIEIPGEIVDEYLLLSYGEVIELYGNLDATLKMGAKLFARNILKKMEEKSGKSVRPPKGKDPVEHLLALLYGLTAEGLKRYASIEVRTSDALGTSAASLSLAIAGEGEGWRQVAYSGQDGNRENYLLEKSAPSLDKALPDFESLHS